VCQVTFRFELKGGASSHSAYSQNPEHKPLQGSAPPIQAPRPSKVAGGPALLGGNAPKELEDMLAAERQLISAAPTGSQ
jgi:hypothetical protein